MSGITDRPYSLLDGDFPRVRAFLDENVGKYGERSRGAEYWEYAHSHTYFEYASHWRNRIWEADGRIVAVAWYEIEPGKAYLTYDTEHKHLLDPMLDYAEKYLSREGKLQVEVTSLQHDRIAHLEARGYKLVWKEEENLFDLSGDVPEPVLPEGFTLIRCSEMEESQYPQLVTAIHQGFDHEGEGDLNSAGLTNASPYARSDLSRVVIAPNGDFACYAGMRFNEKNRYAYLEPLCTHPNYRKLGLAKATLYTILREVKAMGARYMTGGNVPFYKAIGYTTCFDFLTYEKTL